MKTLDEVIKAYEICIGYYCSNAEHDVCPYFGESDMGCMKEPEKDALHYLKEYRDHIKNEIIELQEEVKKQKEMIEFLEKPLTWDELRQMEGKSVWVEEHHGDTKGWLLILRKCDDVVTCTTKHGNSFYLYKANYGEKWQAYRKERS